MLTPRAMDMAGTLKRGTAITADVIITQLKSIGVNAGMLKFAKVFRTPMNKAERSMNNV